MRRGPEAAVTAERWRLGAGSGRRGPAGRGPADGRALLQTRTEERAREGASTPSGVGRTVRTVAIRSPAHHRCSVTCGRRSHRHVQTKTLGLQTCRWELGTAGLSTVRPASASHKAPTQGPSPHDKGPPDLQEPRATRCREARVFLRGE